MGKSLKRWTSSEDEILREHYGTESGQALLPSLLPGRSLSSIINRAYSLGLAECEKQRWTKEEDSILKYYSHSLPLDWKSIKKEIPDRTNNAIATRMRVLGLPMGNMYRDWSDEEDEILRKHYTDKKGIQHLCDLLPGRSNTAIYERARKIGLIKAKPWDKWSDEEISILKESQKLSLAEIQKLLPDRTWDSIVAQRRRMGLCCRCRRWDEEKESILYDNTDMTAREIQKKFLPDYSLNAIKQRAYRLGIKLKSTGNAPWSQEKKKKFAVLYTIGGSNAVMDDESFSDLSRHGIYARARRLGIHAPGTRPVCLSKNSNEGVEEDESI